MTTAERPPVAVLHPLEPLTDEEMRTAVRVLREARPLGPRTVICSVVLEEPEKQVLAAFRPGSGCDRAAFVTLFDRDSGETHEAVVSITGERLESWHHVPGVQPGMTGAELFDATNAIKADPAYIAALAKRGVTDMSLVQIDAWPNGNFGFAEDSTRRLTRALSFVKRFDGDNAYAGPIDGVIAVFDFNRLEVVRVEDHGVVPLPPEDANYRASLVADQRTDLKPLEIIQRDGPGFAVEGHCIRWQKWEIRFGFTHREGLVLNSVGYEDGGRLRSILTRASLSEMVVPYGDPHPMHNRKNAFDAGEYGLGMCTNSLELGCDCLGEIRYFDGFICDAAGEPVRVPNAICLHEEDYGILWKHVDRDNTAEVRRSRRLVLSSIATVGNYEYGFYWYFYQDASIEYEIKLTGIVSNGALPLGEERKYGTVVAPGVYAPIHQHFFSLRLDMAIDGEENSVYEVNTVTEEASADNPFGNAFFAESTLLGRESAAKRRVNPASARYWKVENANVKNRLGQPVAYKLMPGENTVPFNRPESSLIKRAGFTTNHLWVTPYNREERHAAGQYPNQHAGGAGLPEWTAADRPVENTDVVVWYSMGHNHVPRPEDWPVMPTQYMGFKLQPTGFFDRNPALDVAPSMKHGDECEQH
ncbi:MAG: primary-amine oxidase [Dehalococcoidia bacterium]